MAGCTISLHLTLSLMIFLMALITALVAFLPTYISAIDAVDTAVLDLRESFNYRARSSIDDFLQFPLTKLDGLYTTFNSGIVLGNSTAFRSNSSSTSDPNSSLISSFSNRSSFEKLITNIAWGNRDRFSAFWLYIRQGYDEYPFWIYVDTGLDPTNQYPVLATYKDGTFNKTTLSVVFDVRLVNPETMETIPSPLNRGFPFRYRDRENDETTTFDTDFPVLANMSFPRQGYVGIEPLINAPNLRTTCELRDSALEVFGSVRTNMRFDGVQAVMQSLGLRKQSRGVAYVTAPVELVLGVSWDEPPYISTATLFDTRPLYDIVKAKYFHNLTSGGYLTSYIVPLLRQRNVLENPLVESYSTEVDVPEDGIGKTFVDISTISKPGIQVKVLLVMPESDFNEGINRARTAAIGGTIGVLLLMILFAVILGSFVTSPLVQIRERMELASRFADDGSQDGSSRSFLTEVALMQKAYERMRNGLNTAKPYLPQSVLQKVTSSTDDDDDDGEEDERETAEHDETERGGHDVSFNNSSQGRSRKSGGSSAGARRVLDTATSHRSTRSHSSMSKSSNYSSKGAIAPVAAALNISSTVSQKRVTVAVFNLRNIHKRCAGVPADLVYMQKKQLTAISKHVTENRGTIDYFQGDHVQCSFNAVRSCAAHSKRAFVAALSVCEELGVLQDFPRASVGISTGAALCGNMGSDEMRRFCIVGPVVQQANLLERLNKNYNFTQVLTLESIAADHATEFVYRAVDIVQLPRPKSEAPLVIAEVISQIGGVGLGTNKRGPAASSSANKKLEEEEWMYMLDTTGKANPYSGCNQGFRNLMDGEFGTARETFERIQEELQKEVVTSTPKQGQQQSLHSLEHHEAHLVAQEAAKKDRQAQSVERGLEICRRFEEDAEGASLYPVRGWLDAAFLKSSD